MGMSESLRLIMQEYSDKIILDNDIEELSRGNRGIYGLFIKRAETEECAYIGRSEEVSFRVAKHIYKIIDGNHGIAKLNVAFLEKESIIVCKFVEPVEYQFDNYYKDAQRLASRECYWIDYYQERNQCLEQLPEGKRPKKTWWENERLRKIALQTDKQLNVNP